MGASRSLRAVPLEVLVTGVSTAVAFYGFRSSLSSGPFNYVWHNGYYYLVYGSRTTLRGHHRPLFVIYQLGVQNLC